MSLRARLLLVLGFLLVTYAVAAVIIVSTQRDLLLDQVDGRLTSVSPADIAALPEPPPLPAGNGPDEAEPPILDGRVALQPGGGSGIQTSPFSDLYIGVIQPDGATTSLLIGGSLPGGMPDIAAAVDATNGAADLVTVNAVEGSSRFRALVMPQPGASGVLVVAQPLNEIDAALDRLTRTLWIAGGIIAAILAMTWFWIQRLGLRPIARVTTAAEAIAAGDRSRRVDVADARTEAGKLGHAFNVMLDERDAVETRLRQFVADASHELRTPLTSVRGYLDLYRQGAFREEGQLDDVVRRLSAESARMHGLVEDLLALASLDEDRPLTVEAVEVGQMLCDAAQDAQAAQPGRQVEVQAPPDGLMVPGDQALLIQLVGILVANALAHTPVGTPVTLATGRTDDVVAITVADRGPGLDPAVAARVFDRFWRGESARTRGAGSAPSGSTGLGLAIARSIAEAHGGSIDLETAVGEGCTFTVHLPG